jgi:hypothetical protein
VVAANLVKRQLDYEWVATSEAVTDGAEHKAKHKGKKKEHSRKNHGR